MWYLPFAYVHIISWTLSFAICVLSEAIWPMFQYSDKIFFHGQAIIGLCNTLVMQLQKVVTLSSPDILEQYCTIVVEALTFGPVHRRDQRSVIRHASAYFVLKLSFVCITLLVLYRHDTWSLIQRSQRLCLETESRGEYIDLKEIM
jgi:hypothetical protein